MIPPLPGGANALPQIDRAALPADIRKSSTEDQKAYKAALGFERMLVGQLAKSMTNAQNALSEEQQEGGSGTPAAYKDMLADSLADNVTRAGGVGLARDLFETMKAAR